MKKILFSLFIIPVCLLSIITFVYLFSLEESPFFIQNVKINGAEQMGEGDIMKNIKPFLKKTLIGVDVDSIKDAITAHPFIREARIKRLYPFSIIIDVKEKRPSALWVNSEGVVIVIDEQGDPYKRPARGLDIKDLFVINAREQSEVKSVYNEIDNWFSSGTIKRGIISEAVYDEGNITLFGLDDGLEIILGKEDRDARLKKALTVMEDARKRGILIKCIDTRFEKGAIIQERKG